MREIKFKYGYSDSINTFEKAFTLEEIEQGLQFEEISDSPLLKNYKIVYKRQYTGLKDKNGVEVYEGDILINVVANSKYGVVYFEDGMFIMRADNNDYIHHYLSELCKHSEIIGNIYENRDLLKG